MKAIKYQGQLYIPATRCVTVEGVPLDVDALKEKIRILQVLVDELRVKINELREG